MLDVLEDLIRRHRHSGILVDTNLLMVFLLAIWDQEVALQFKRTQAYEENDLELLKLVLSQFDRCIVTPAVLAEVGNLTEKLREPDRTEFFRFLVAAFGTALYEQQCVSLNDVVGAECFVRLGFTDATIEQLGRAGTPVLTDDLPLYTHLSAQNIETFNITHIRFLGQEWDS